MEDEGLYSEKLFIMVRQSKFVNIGICDFWKLEDFVNQTLFIILQKGINLIYP